MKSFLKVVLGSIILTFFKRMLLVGREKITGMSLSDVVNIVFDKKEFLYDVVLFVVVFYSLKYIIKKI